MKTIERLKKQTKQFGLRVIKITDAMPFKRSANVLGEQLLRSGTAVGAYYRAACRARSRSEFISKASLSIEEADKSLYWMEMLIESGLIPEDKLSSLVKEADEIVAVLTMAVDTARAGMITTGALRDPRTKIG
jgi:four helix bundle protein